MSTATLPAYEALALDVKAMGIEAVFGLMSDDMALFAATLDAVGVAFHGARHENVAVCMAEGFGFQAATVRSMEDLQALVPRLAPPDGPILLDVKINGAVVAPFHYDGAAPLRS